MDGFEMLEAANAAKEQKEQQTAQPAKVASVVSNETQAVGNDSLEDGQGNEDGNTDGLDLGSEDPTQQKPNAESGAVEMPKDLEEYAELLKSRGWDSKMSTPVEFTKEVLKSYTELEKEMGRKGNLEGVLTGKLEEYESVLAGDPTRLNEARKAIGLEPFQFLDPQAKAQEVNELFDLFNVAYSALQGGTKNPEAEAKIIATIQKINDDARVHQIVKGNIAPQSIDTLKANARNSIKAISKESGEKFEDIIARMDVVDKDHDISNLMRSIAGPNMLSLVSTPERAKGYNQLMKYVQKGMSFEAELKKGIETGVAEMRKKLRGAQNAGGSGGGLGGSPSGQKQINQHAKELMEMSSGGRAIFH